MKQIFTNLKVFLTLLLLCGVGSMWATATWTLVTSVDELKAGGTFVLGYKGSADGQIIPLRSVDCNAKTTANGYFFTGTTANTSSSGQININTATDLSAYEIEISASTNTDGAVNIKIKDGFIGATSKGGTKNSGRLYSTGNSNETDLTPSYDTSKGFSFVANVTGSYKYLKYNTSSPRFAFYNSNGDGIVIYKKGAPSTDPSISASDVTLESDATSGEIAYTIANPVEGKSLTATTDAEWISNLTVGAGKVTFSTTANAGAERTAEVTLKYEGATDKVVKVTQKKPMPVYESLAALVNAGTPTKEGETVKVTLTDEVITDIDISGQYRNGIYLKSGDQEVEIYCWNVPEEWIVGGTVSGTLTCTWQLYEKTNTWELCPESWEDLTYTAPAGVYEVVIDELENGSITANPATAVKGTEITLTVTPNLHYSLKEGSLIVLDEEGAEVPVTNYKFTMPASDVLVGAEFEEAPKCTVLYSSLGEEVGDGEEVYVGECVTSLPTPTNTPDGWTFAGWTANESYEMSSTAPVMFTATTPVEEDLILYAVFCKSEGGSGETAWNLVRNADELQSGDVIRLAAIVDGSKTDSNNGTFAASPFGDATFFNSVAATIEDDQLTADGAIDIILIRNGNLSWTLKTDDGVVGTKTAKKMVLDSSDDGVVNEWTIDINNETGAATITAGDFGKILYNRDSPRFVNYTSAASASMVLPYIFCKYEAGAKIYTISLAQSHDVTITSAGYATAYVPFAATVEGATAYYVTVSGSTATLNKIEGTIPANTGVILEGEEGTATLKASANTPESVDGNLLKGTVKEGGEDFEDLGFTYYILSDGEYGVGFYWDGEDYDEFEGMGAHCDQYKAILAVPETVGAPNFFSLDGEATAIQNVEDAQMKNAAAFNLAGQVVNRDYKGIVIMNGKKFLNK